MTINSKEMQGIFTSKKHGLMLLPPEPGVCQECATDHQPEAPHNQQSLYYQYSFKAKHGRWPTWGDALAHCEESLRATWKTELKKRGIKC